MSGVSSEVQVPSATVYDVLGQNGYIMQPTGSVYRLAAVAAADGEAQSIRITPLGEQYVTSDPASPLSVQGATADADSSTGFPVYVGGIYVAALPTYTDGDRAALHTDVNGRMLVALAPDAATETTLAAIAVDINSLEAKDFATQTTLDLVRVAAQSIAGEDFATETTLAAIAVDINSLEAKDFATQTTLDLVRVATQSIAGEDFATETTLAAIAVDINSLEAKDFATQTTLDLVRVATQSIAGEDFATETTLAAIAVDINSLEAKDFATETTLDALNTKVNQDFGVVAGAVRVAAIPGNAAGIADFNVGNAGAQTPRVVLASDQPAVSTKPATPTALTVKQAAITVGTTAVRLTHDGAAPSATRRRVRFMPDQASTGRFFYGSSSVTSSGATRGTEIFPGQTEEFLDDAAEYYIISDTAAQTVYVVEQE